MDRVQKGSDDQQLHAEGLFDLIHSYSFDQLEEVVNEMYILDIDILNIYWGSTVEFNMMYHPFWRLAHQHEKSEFVAILREPQRLKGCFRPNETSVGHLNEFELTEQSEHLYQFFMSLEAKRHYEIELLSRGYEVLYPSRESDEIFTFEL